MANLETFAVMPVDIFVGGCGHIVLCQEWTDEKSESYLRVMIDPSEAEEVCRKIMAAANEARKGRP